jgi:hypothetical protein
MTHADTLAWWALILAVLALVLHIPLSMLAHHYLPKVEDYLASSSRERLNKRITRLQHRLDQLSDPKYFEELEWIFREHLFVVLYLFGSGFFIGAAGLFLPKTSKLWNPELILLNRFPEIAIVFFIVGVVIAGQNMFKSSSLRPSRRPKRRLEIQAQVDALKAKLAVFK